jgi:[ribosomal protein S5]-alanine N-acetyltransferase
MKAVFSFIPFPEISTERLILNRTLPADAAELYVMRNDEQVMRFVERPRPVDEGDALSMILQWDSLISQNSSIAWAIRQKGGSKMIGVIGFWRAQPEHFRAELGYMLMPEYWGKGLMKEALHEVLKYGFGYMGLHSIEADINPENIASAALLRSCGFRSEAFFRENYFWEGKFYNSEIFGLLASDYIR